MSVRVPVLAVALLLAVTGCGARTAAPPPPRSEAALPGPTRVEGSVPVGYPQTAEGARDAALRYVAVLGGPLMLDPARRDTALAAVSPDGQPMPDVAARWATRPNVERVAGAQDALRSGARLLATAAPVMSRVTAYDGGRSRPRVWCSSLRVASR